MSGPPNQPPFGGRAGGWNSRGGNPPSSSPSFMYRPPSPWTPVAPSPPPIISGPRGPSMQSPGQNHAMSPSPQGLRGTRVANNISYPRPQWPLGPQNYQSGLQQEQQPKVCASPLTTVGFNGPRPYRPMHSYSPGPNSSTGYTPMSSFQLSPTPSPVVFAPSQEYMFQNPSTSYNEQFTRQQQPQYQEQPKFDYVGAPTPPLPKSYIIYDDEEEQGPTTAEIIANQSQDYIDEKLAEYQLTILQLQGEFCT